MTIEKTLRPQANDQPTIPSGDSQATGGFAFCFAEDDAELAAAITEYLLKNNIGIDVESK